MTSFNTDIPAMLSSIESSQKSIANIIGSAEKITKAIASAKWSIGTSIKIKLFFRSFFSSMKTICKYMVDYYNYTTNVIPISKTAKDVTVTIVDSTLNIITKVKEFIETSQKLSASGLRKAVALPFKIVYMTIEKTMELSNFILTGKRPGFHLFNRKYDPEMIRKGLSAFKEISNLLMPTFKVFQPAVKEIIELGKIKKRQIRNGFKLIQLVLSKTIELVDNYFVQIDEKEMKAASQKALYLSGLANSLAGVMTSFASIGLLVGIPANIGIWFANLFAEKLVILVENFKKLRVNKNIVNQLAICNVAAMLTLGVMVIFGSIGILLGMSARIGAFFALSTIYVLIRMVEVLNSVKKNKVVDALVTMSLISLMLLGAGGILAVIAVLGIFTITAGTLLNVFLFLLVSAELLIGIAGIIHLLNEMKLGDMVRSIMVLNLIIGGIIVGIAARGLIWILSEIENSNITLKTLWNAVLFVAVSGLLLAGMAVIISLLGKFKLAKIAAATAVLALIVTGLLVGLGAMGLIYLLAEIDKMSISGGTLLNVLLFCGCALVLSLGIFLIIKILGEIPLGTAIKACLIMAVFAGTLLLFGWALGIIQESAKDLELTTILVFAGAVLILTGIVLVMGLVGMVAGPVLLGLGVMVLALGAVLLISLELILLAKIDTSTIDKAKENAKLVFSTVMEILLSFAQDAALPGSEADSGFLKFLKAMGGVAAMIALAFASMAFVILSFVTITIVLLIAFELTILGELDMASRKQKIMDNVNIVFDTVKEIFSKINEQMETTNSDNDKGILGSVVNLISPQLNAILDALFMFAFAALSVLTIGMVLIIATELRLIQELDLNAELISNNIKIVFDSVNQIIAAVLAPPEKEGEPMEEGVLGMLVRFVYPPFANILNAIFTFAYVAISLLTVAGVMLIAMSLKKIQDIELNPEKIRTNLDAIFTSINSVHAAIMVKRDLKDEGEDKSWFKDLLSNLPGLGTISKIADAISEMGTVATSMIIVGSIASIAESLKKIETITLNAKTVQVNTQNIMNCVDLVWKKLQGWGLEDADKDLFKNMERLMNGVSKLADASIKFSKVDPAKHASATNDIIKLIDKTKTIDVSKLNTVTLMFKQLADFSKSIRGNFDKLADVLNDKLIEILEKLHVALKDIKESDKSFGEKPVASAPVASTGPVSIADKAKAVATKAAASAAAKGAANTPGGKVDLSEIEKELKEITKALTSTLSVTMSS